MQKLAFLGGEEEYSHSLCIVPAQRADSSYSQEDLPNLQLMCQLYIFLDRKVLQSLIPWSLHSLLLQHSPTASNVPNAVMIMPLYTHLTSLLFIVMWFYYFSCCFFCELPRIFGKWEVHTHTRTHKLPSNFNFLF